MLSYEGWVDGITATFVVTFGCVFGVIFHYKSKKLKTNLLNYLSLTIIFAGFMYLGVFLDFITVFLTGNNLGFSYGLVGVLSYLWLAPLILIGMQFGAELIKPNAKWIILIINVVLFVFFEYFIFFDTRNTFNIINPAIPGTNLIDYNLNFGTPASILFLIFNGSIILFMGIGFLIRGFQTSGVIRKKFIFCALGIFLYSAFGMLEGLITPGVALIIVRVGYIVSPLLLYFGLKKVL